MGGEAADNMMGMQVNAGISPEDATATTQGIFDKISELNLDSDQTISLLAKISEADSIDAINEGLARIQESGDIKDFEVEVDEQSVKDQLAAIKEEDIDSDIDFEEFQNLSSYLSDTAAEMEGFDAVLEEDADLVSEITEEILRFDSALEDAQDNMEN